MPFKAKMNNVDTAWNDAHAIVDMIFNLCVYDFHQFVLTRENKTSKLCSQRNFRSACAFKQSIVTHICD